MKKHSLKDRAGALLLALTLTLSLAPGAFAAPEEGEATSPPAQGPGEMLPETPPETPETPPAPTSSAQDKLQLETTSISYYAGQYQNIDLIAPAAKVLNGERDVTGAYKITYAWKMEGEANLLEGPTLRTTPIYTGSEKVVCIATATAQDGSGRVLTGECVFQVEILPATAVGATITLAEGPQALSALTDLTGQQTIAQQLLEGGDDPDSAPAVEGLKYIEFDLSTQAGTAAGRLNAIHEQPYYLDGQAGHEQLSQLVFTPAKTGTYTVNFRAYGTKTYFGRLEVVVHEESGPSIPGVDGKTLTCDSAGTSFTGSDFYDAASDDPVVAVRFGDPSAGYLLRGFGKGQAVQEELYYTDNAADGAYHISTVFYLPNASFNGLASLPVTCVTRSGQEVQRTIGIHVETKDTSDQFQDVTLDTVGGWAANAIDFAYKHKLVSGVEEKRFAPNNPMTRGMLVTVLYRAAGSPSAAVTCNFTDLEDGAYYYNPVVWASANGVVNGITAERFGPDEPVSRQQIAAILYRYAKLMDVDVGTSGATLDIYTDAKDIESYAQTPMTWAVRCGIISGTAEATLSPLSNATRAQVVVMLHRYLTML